jgi:hypothetical protein
MDVFDEEMYAFLHVYVVDHPIVDVAVADTADDAMEEGKTPIFLVPLLLVS